MTNAFDEIFDTVRDFADKASKKTVEFVDLSKVRLEIATINSDIKRNFEKLGSLTYNAGKKDGGNPELAAICFKEIDELYARLADCKAKIDAAKNLVRCQECGTANSIIAAYCYVCGAKLTNDEPDASDETASENADSKPETAEAENVSSEE